MGLAGFGIGLVSLALLPYVMSPADAIVLMTLYAAAFALAIFVPVRRDFTSGRVGDLVLGTVAGTPLGVWALASVEASLLNRLIGLMLLVAVALEWGGRSPARLEGRRWGLGAGVLAGAIGGVAAGMALFDRIDPVRFRRLVFALLFVSGLVLFARG